LNSALALNPSKLAAITNGQVSSGLLQAEWHATSLTLGVLSEAAYTTVEGSPLFTSTLVPAGFTYAKSISVAIGLVDWKVFSKPVVDAQCTVLATSTDIVVAVRGSEPTGLRDWVTTNFDVFDFTSSVWFPTTLFSEGLVIAQPWPFDAITGDNTGTVHSGFYEYTLALLPGVKSAIKDACVKNPEANKVWLTGHNMGGAVAVLLATYLQDSKFIVPPGSSQKGLHACATELVISGVMGFESPRVGDATFARHYEDIGLDSQTLMYIYDQDPVPSLPPWPYQHVGHIVYTQRSLGDPDTTLVTGPSKDVRGAPSGWGIGDHAAMYWLPPLRNLAADACDAAVSSNLITPPCPDFAKLTASVVAPTDEVAVIRGSVYYMYAAGQKQVPTGVVDVTCYDYDAPAAATLLVDEREPMCKAQGVGGKFSCRYHRKTAILWRFGAWDVISPGDWSEAQSWPDIECDIKPAGFLTGTHTGRLSENEDAVETDAGEILLNPDRSDGCKLSGCGVWLLKVPANKLSPWFKVPCKQHACCYSTCGTTQKLCDDELQRNMEWKCHQLASASQRALCMTSSLVYYGAAHTFGADSWESAQIANFCLGPGKGKAAIIGRIVLADATGHRLALAGVLVRCYDRDPLSAELMCMAKSSASGDFRCYYLVRDSKNPWDFAPGFNNPDIGCSVQHKRVKYNKETNILAFNEDWKQAPTLHVGTIVVTAAGNIYKA
jgi:pimeloyl-ACP methyl ester carboxylesterase